MNNKQSTGAEHYTKLEDWHSEECKLTSTFFDLKWMGDRDLSRSLPPAKFSDDTSSGFCFRVLTYNHTYTHTLYVQNR